MDGSGGRSAIVVPIALPDALEAIRRDHVANARLGVPAHVTLLFPFVPVALLGPGTIEEARPAVAATQAFDVDFVQPKVFAPGPTKEGVVWLAPDPPDPFIALTEALARAFPGYLPYGGLHDTVIPHLTLANVDVDLAALVSAARSALPFRRRVESAALIVEDGEGRWGIAEYLALG